MICKHEVTDYIRCPFCGADPKYLFNPAEFFNYSLDLNSLNEREMENLLTTLELEQTNVLFYRELEDRFSNNLELESYFRHTRRHEEYHRDEIMDILGVEEDIEVDTLEIPDSKIEIFTKAEEIEEDAVSFYEQAIEETDKMVLKEIYNAFITAENYHIDIFKFLSILEENR